MTAESADKYRVYLYKSHAECDIGCDTYQMVLSERRKSGAESLENILSQRYTHRYKPNDEYMRGLSQGAQ